MRETSLEAYFNLKSKLGPKQIKVLTALKEFHPATDMMLKEHLGYLDPNQVRPRRKELLDMRLIREHHRDKCQVTGRRAIYWEAKNA